MAKIKRKITGTRAGINLGSEDNFAQGQYSQRSFSIDPQRNIRRDVGNLGYVLDTLPNRDMIVPVPYSLVNGDYTGGYTSGSISTTVGSATVNGVITSFTSDMVGMGLFIGSTSNDVVYSREIASVSSGTVLTLTGASGYNYNGSTFSIRPMAYSWLVPQPKSNYMYAYGNRGHLTSFLYSYSGGYATIAESNNLGKVANSYGEGAVYYNNYLYLFSNSNIARYGPLDGTPALVDTVWTGTTLGSQKALGNALTDKAIQHVGHVHTDNKLYITDYNGGKGMIHSITTTYALDYDAQASNFTVGDVVTGGTSGATGVIYADSDAGATGTLSLISVIGAFTDNETITGAISGSATVNGTLTQGKANWGSLYNALDLPDGYYPVDIKGYGTDLVILAHQYTPESTTSAQYGNNAALFFWDTFSDSFYRQVTLPAVQGIALANKNGQIYVFNRAQNSSVQIHKYIGGESVSYVAEIPNAVKMLGPSNVFVAGDRLYFAVGRNAGTGYSADVYAMGPTDDEIHPVFGNKKASYISGYAYVPFAICAGIDEPTQSSSLATKSAVLDSGQPTIWLSSGIGVEKNAYINTSLIISAKTGQTMTQNCRWVSEFVRIDEPHQVTGISVRLPLGVKSTTQIKPIIMYDHDISNSIALPTINETNFPSEETDIFNRRVIRFLPTTVSLAHQVLTYYHRDSTYPASWPSTPFTFTLDGTSFTGVASALTEMGTIGQLSLSSYEGTYTTYGAKNIDVAGTNYALSYGQVRSVSGVDGFQIILDFIGTDYDAVEFPIEVEIESYAEGVTKVQSN